jgi:hypothetical protein
MGTPPTFKAARGGYAAFACEANQYISILSIKHILACQMVVAA